MVKAGDENMLRKNLARKTARRNFTGHTSKHNSRGRFTESNASGAIACSACAAGRFQSSNIGDKLPEALTIEVLDLLAECYDVGANTLALYRQYALAPSPPNMEAT